MMNWKSAQGSVSLKVGYHEVAPDKTRIRFQVEDTGIGVAPENWESIFLPFHQASDARDGESAITQAKYAQPDLILLDVLMPGIDGFETCARLKNDRELKDIPVIFMTALSETVDKVKGFNAGAADYITKPLQHEEVLARINTHLTLRQLQKNLQEARDQLERRVQERTAELSQVNSHLRKYFVCAERHAL